MERALGFTDTDKMVSVTRRRIYILHQKDNARIITNVSGVTGKHIPPRDIIPMGIDSLRKS